MEASLSKCALAENRQAMLPMPTQCDVIEYFTMRAASLFFFTACLLHAQNATRPGRFHVEHPTLLNLGFEWAIEGDANRNASVEVRFRKAGTASWRSALPLLRIGGERVYRDQYNMTYTVPEGFAGSILNLEPATSYECEFKIGRAHV